MSAVNKPSTAIWTRNFILLSLSNALLFAGFNLVLPTLPLFAMAYGATSTQIGLIIGSFTFSAIGIRLFIATGISRWGRNRFFRMGLSLCVFSMASYYFTAQASSTILVRLAHGLGFGIASTLYATLVVELIPATRRGEGLGYFSLGSTFMMAFAPLAGVWLYGAFMAEGLFLVGTILQALALISLQFISMADKVAVPSRREGSAKLPVRQMLFPCFLSLLLGICAGGVISFITLLINERNFGNPGLFFLTSTSCVFFVRTFSGRIYDRLGAPWVIVPATLSLFIAMLFLFIGNTSILVAAAFYGVGLGILFPALQAWMLQVVPREKQTTANSIFYNSLDIGIGGGSILLGFIADGQSYTTVYLVTSAISFVLFISYLLYLGRKAVSSGLQSD